MLCVHLGLLPSDHVGPVLVLKLANILVVDPFRPNVLHNSLIQHPEWLPGEKPVARLGGMAYMRVGRVLRLDRALPGEVNSLA